MNVADILKLLSAVTQTITAASQIMTAAEQMVAHVREIAKKEGVTDEEMRDALADSEKSVYDAIRERGGTIDEPPTAPTEGE